MLRSGEWARGRRTHESLERGGVRPEGAYSPRVGRSFAREVPRPAACWAAEVAWAVGSCHQIVIA
jgi:hypothetical protein